MKDQVSIRRTEVRVIVVLVATLAGVVGLLGFAVDDASRDTSHIEPLRSARAALLSHAPQAAAPVRRGVGGAPVTVAPEEWAADESSNGLRPDAAR